MIASVFCTQVLQHLFKASVHDIRQSVQDQKNPHSKALQLIQKRQTHVRQLTHRDHAVGLIERVLIIGVPGEQLDGAHDLEGVSEVAQIGQQLILLGITHLLNQGLGNSTISNMVHTSDNAKHELIVTGTQQCYDDMAADGIGWTVERLTVSGHPIKNKTAFNL